MTLSKKHLEIIAEDIFKGKIFKSDLCRTEEELFKVFPRIKDINEETKEVFKTNPPALFYEYYSKGIDDGELPVFKDSFNYLDTDEYKVMLSFYKKLEKQNV